MYFRLYFFGLLFISTFSVSAQLPKFGKPDSLLIKILSMNTKIQLGWEPFLKYFSLCSRHIHEKEGWENKMRTLNNRNSQLGTKN